MSAYPPFDSLLRSPDPKNVLQAKRSFLSILSQCAKVFIATVIVVIINAAFDGVAPFSLIYSGLPDISLRWLGIVPALLLLNAIREYHDDLYIFGLHGVTEYQGRLSLTKRVPHIKYSDILSLRVRQDPWGRIFNYGDIDLDTAADAGVEIIIEGIYSPDELCLLIEKLRRHSFKTGMADNISISDQEELADTVVDE